MIIVADKHGRTDSAYHSFNGRLNVGIPVVIVSWVEDFVFNEDLLNIKDYVLICFCEYGYDFKIVDTHVWGTGNAPERYRSEEWDKFDNWVKENPFKVFFKRELLQKDVTDKIKPIEYPSIVNHSFPTQTKEEFNNRPIQAFQYWGRSNEHRLRIHSEIWLYGYTNGIQPCDNIFYIEKYLQEEKGEKWVTLWIPHYYRVDVSNLLNINFLSKLSLSWEGAGTKCFRSAEAPLNSIMVMHKNNMAWTHSWDESNCILVDNGKEIEGIVEALKRDDLHDVYLRGVENAKRYQIEEYSNHLVSIINNA